MALDIHIVACCLKVALPFKKFKID